jgi:tetratricopeptide (TPR) repeat protein
MNLRPQIMILLAVLGWQATAAGQQDVSKHVAQQIELIERQLHEWRFIEARETAQQLLAVHPDLPAVQLAAGWVKFHFAEHRAAHRLIDRAQAALGDNLVKDFRVGLIQAAYKVTAGFVSQTSPDGRVVVYHDPGLENILTPYLIETVEQTLAVVGKDLGFFPAQPILVEILPDSAVLAEMTGLSTSEIKTSGTIAVCKYGRLLVTSPRATLKGYGWLDTASHELVHMIISQKTHNHTPIWIHEALAKLEERRWRSGEPLYEEGLLPQAQSNLARALRDNSLVTFEQMHPSMALLPSAAAAELAFSEVYLAARFLLSRKGYVGISKMLEFLRDGQSDFESIRRVYGLKKDAFVADWTAYMRRQKLVVLRGDEIFSKDMGDRPPVSRGERALSSGRNVGLRDLFHLGELLRARGRTSASVVEYHKAVRKAGKNHAALWLLSDKLGVALLMLGRDQEARLAFRSSLSVNPNDLEARLHIASLLLEEDPYRAWLQLRECLRINPLDPRVQTLSLKAAEKLRRQGNTDQDWLKLADRYKRAIKILASRKTQGVSATPVEKQKDSKSDSAGLRIFSRPWARVWLDYRDTGLTTPVYNLRIKPGEHIVALSAACRADPVVVRIVVEKNGLEVIDRDLCPSSDDSIPAGK